ncbi:hypothetical protein DFH06DRAFT_1325101 [Mycena polygramma]|nr:hypothetical protein DFH06DRAFT_1325101 [Mycena polygramma]
MKIRDEHNANIKSTDSMAVCYLNDTFRGAVKALALCTGFNTHFVRMDGNRYDQSSRLYYTVAGGEVTSSWEKVLSEYNNTFADDAIVVVSFTEENAESSRSLYPIEDDDIIAHSSDPVAPE